VSTVLKEASVRTPLALLAVKSQSANVLTVLFLLKAAPPPDPLDKRGNKTELSRCSCLEVSDATASMEPRWEFFHLVKLQPSHSSKLTPITRKTTVVRSGEQLACTILRLSHKLYLEKCQMIMRS